VHYGSGSGTGFGSGSNIKCTKEVEKSKMRGQLSGIYAASDIVKARFCAVFFNCAKYGLDPESEPNFSKVETGNATNPYGSTTLPARNPHRKRTPLVFIF
jgi:hypothetical protein